MDKNKDTIITEFLWFFAGFVVGATAGTALLFYLLNPTL